MVDKEITLRFEEIYDETYQSVLRFVIAKCSNTADIEDILQETYVDLYQVLKRRGLDYIQNPEAMVILLAKQKIYRHYSLKDRLKQVLPMTILKEDGREVDLTDFDLDLFLEEEFMLQRLKLQEARTWIQAKPLDVRKIFYLFYVQDSTLKEIATLLCMTESNVKHKLYRTLNEIRAKFK